MIVHSLFDPGLQPERTELAWRRTALAIAIGSLLSLRVFPLALPSRFEAWGLVPGLVGLVAALVFWLVARERRSRLSSLLIGASTQPTGGGWLLAALTSLATGMGIIAMAVMAVAAFT